MNDTKLQRFEFRLIHLIQLLAIAALFVGLLMGFRSSANLTFIVDRFPDSDAELKEWLVDNYPCDEISLVREEEAVNGGKNKLLHVRLEGSRKNLLAKRIQIPWEDFKYKSGFPSNSRYKAGIWNSGFWPVPVAIGILLVIGYFSRRNSNAGAITEKKVDGGGLH